MHYKKIIILKDTVPASQVGPDTLVIDFQEFKTWIKTGKIIKHFFHYDDAKLIGYRLGVIYKPFFVALVMRFMSKGKCLFEDVQGDHFTINARTLLGLFWRLMLDFWRRPAFMKYMNSCVQQLLTQSLETSKAHQLDLSKTPAYLRTDLVFGIRSGGSIGHIAGVLNSLDCLTGKPVFLTTDYIPTTRNDIETFLISPDDDFRDLSEIPLFNINRTFEEKAVEFLQDKNISFFYQRYSLDNFVGARLAKQYKVPFVLEYNGSELWISHNWGNRLRYESLSEKIEFSNLKVANLVVVVSQALKNELVNRGIEAGKILVNPNGVDPKKYSPEIDGSKIIENLGFSNKIVIGFIGTFGMWHGAEVLAEAFGKLIQQYPGYRDNVRLLMIGHGVTMPQVKENLEKFKVCDLSSLPGIIPQEEGPQYLDVCDILVSPHVPNPDGSPFFGSPTKLFEYMAMGRGIVASDLDQIGEILEHKKTAWLAKPGDVDSLIEGLKVLIEDEPLRKQLGAAAREEVIAKYTWKEHTRRIIEALKERMN